VVLSNKPLKHKENQAMAHSSTIFSQLLKLTDRHDFSKITTGGSQPNRKLRTLKRSNQFVAMKFARNNVRSSLQDIDSHFGFQFRRLYHLGTKTVERSTVPDDNNQRRAELFKTLFHQYS